MKANELAYCSELIFARSVCLKYLPQCLRYCSCDYRLLFCIFQALETLTNSKATYEKTAQDIKEKHTAQKDEMMKTVAEGMNKILADKIKEVEKVYDPACQKLSVQAETISNYVQKVEKSLQRTDYVSKNSKLEELLSAQKVLDDDIQTLQNEKPQNLTTFQAQVENPQSCTKQLSFYIMFKELAFKCKYSVPLISQLTNL